MSENPRAHVCVYGVKAWQASCDFPDSCFLSRSSGCVMPAADLADYVASEESRLSSHSLLSSHPHLSFSLFFFTSLTPLIGKTALHQQLTF